MTFAIPHNVRDVFEASSIELSGLAREHGWNITPGPFYQPRIFALKGDGLDLSHDRDPTRYDLSKVDQHFFFAKTLTFTRPHGKTSGGYPVDITVDLLCATKKANGEILASSANVDLNREIPVHVSDRRTLVNVVREAFTQSLMLG